MSISDPAQIAAKFNALKTRCQQAAETAALASLSREITDVSAKVRSLSSDIARIRERRYVFSKYLEHKAEVVQEHWQPSAEQAQERIESERAALQQDIEQANVLIQKAEMVANNPKVQLDILPMIENAVTQLETKTKAATDQIKALYSPHLADINQTVEQLRKINWYLNQRDEASFSFLAGESVFLAADAEWVVTGQGGKDPDGILFLTDQRLVFEQKETTGKTLGLFGGKKAHEMKWEVPLNQIEKVEAENKGLFGGKDMLNFTLGSGARYPIMTVEVKGGVQSKFWAAQINRMVSGETDDERAIQPDPEMIAAIRSAPTACHVCGATLPRLIANQTQISCEYCGAVIRL